MPRPYQPLVINNFGGENDTTPSTELADNQGDVVQNMYLVNQGLERRLGSKVGCTGTAKVIQGVLWCRIPLASPTEQLVYVADGFIRDFFRNTGTFPNAGQASTTYSDPLNSGVAPLSLTANVDMAVVDNHLYVADGVNPMLRLNGTTTYSQVGLAAPTTAPTFNAFVGAGVLTGNVSYVMTYVDQDGNESEASAASATLTPAAQNVTLNIPNDADSHGFRASKNLYRRGVASTVYKLVNASPIAAGATTYTDSVTDANLGAQLITGNTLMPSCAHLWEHDNRLIGCGNVALSKTLFISNQGQPWYCPSSPNLADPTQGVRLQVQGRNSVIVGGISHGGYCFIFTDEGGYILQGTTLDDYRIERFTPHGCVSHRSIKSIRNWLFWVGPDGVYRFDGTNTERIDYPIQTFFRALTNAQLATASAWVYNDRYYVAFTGPSGKNTKCFDTRFDRSQGYTATGWSYLGWTSMRYYLNTPYACVTTAPSQSGNAGVTRVFACTSSANAVTQLETPGYYLDDSPDTSGNQRIAASWISKQFEMGLPGRDKRVHLWGCKVRNPAQAGNFDSSALTSSIYTSGSPTASTGTAAQVVTTALSPSSTGQDWGIDPQAGNNITIVRQEGVEQLRSEVFQMVITHSDDSSDFRLCEAELYWTMAG